MQVESVAPYQLKAGTEDGLHPFSHPEKSILGISLRGNSRYAKFRESFGLIDKYYISDEHAMAVSLVQELPILSPLTDCLM